MGVYHLPAFWAVHLSNSSVTIAGNSIAYGANTENLSQRNISRKLESAYIVSPDRSGNVVNTLIGPCILRYQLQGSNKTSPSWLFGSWGEHILTVKPAAKSISSTLHRSVLQKTSKRPWHVSEISIFRGRPGLAQSTWHFHRKGKNHHSKCVFRSRDEFLPIAPNVWVSVLHLKRRTFKSRCCWDNKNTLLENMSAFNPTLFSLFEMPTTDMAFCIKILKLDWVLESKWIPVQGNSTLL